MNILFFLTPKALCSYIDDGCTLRQAMERMENSGYTALPVLDKDGGYCGVLTEGTYSGRSSVFALWSLRQTEDHSISEITARREVHPVRVDTRIEDLASSRLTRTLSPSSMIKTHSSALSRAARF